MQVAGDAGAPHFGCGRDTRGCTATALTKGCVSSTSSNNSSLSIRFLFGFVVSPMNPLPAWMRMVPFSARLNPNLCSWQHQSSSERGIR